MKIVYRITSPDDTAVAYAHNLRAADALASIIINNGGIVKVERLKWTQVPLNEIHLVTL